MAKRPAATDGKPAFRASLRGASRRFTLNQISTLMGLSGLVVLAAGTAYVAWNEHRVLVQEAHDHAEQSAAYLADHAQRLFEVADIVLHATGSSLGALSWDDVQRTSDITTGMRRLDDLLPFVDTVFAADAAGHVRATTLTNPPPDYSIAGRSIFTQAATETEDQLIIGERIVGRVSGRPTFLVARRRVDATGTFDGVVGAAMTLTYFTDYWRTLDKRNDEQIALVRAGSGSVLARYPESGDADRLGASLAAATAGGERIGTFDPAPHAAGTFRQVSALPVYVAVIFKDAVITAQWHALLWRLVPIAAAAMLALLGIMALARRLGRREEAARRQIETARAVLSAANQRLELRVAERTAALVESNRETQRFAYIVSHDLRAPLVNIMGFTSELQGLRDEVLLREAPLDEAARQRLRADFEEAFGFIGSSIDKMDRLIKAILALSRQGQRVLRPEPLDMDALMRSVVDGVAHRVQQSGTSVTVGDLPGLVADRIAVEQVFANLVDNAVKYLRTDIPGVIAITGSASATSVTYTVADNGRGIDPADRDRVFELFRRAGKQDRPGEGIGLANVRSLIRRLQGTITLDSAAGLGCVFSVTLPVVATDSKD